MKSLRVLSFVAILGLAFTSCSRDDSNDLPTPAKKQFIQISSKGNDVSIETFELVHEEIKRSK
ncbi:hypothetical protein [uncultured Acetobacteroides sp.]|uniref:hypothetical protein n=1 Tax=uncultured Acetobacteroides sp. TaxID=1760811 RepID=UPI0029F4707B|nr:hypothetical protein [uncultured Acetobacteroides sp.]